MNLVFFKGNDCNICDEAEAAFKKVFAAELKSGEADIVNLDEDEKAQQIWAENDLELAPTIIVISDGLKVIATLDPQDIIDGLKEGAKSPAAAMPP